MKCPYCGEAVTRRGRRGRPAIYCTHRCMKRAAQERAKTDGRYAARLEAGRAHRAAMPKSIYTLTCQCCQGEMTSSRSDAKFCSRKCSRDGQQRGCSTPSCARPLRAKGMCNTCYRRARGEKSVWTDAKRDRYHRRRAQKVGTALADRPVILADIRERDKNRCHLCRKRVSSKPYPHPLSASLDHVIPLSLDGQHVPENVRLAHLQCNVEKGNGGGNEQLLLIG